MHRVVIVGGGFGGLSAARGLRRVDVDVVVVDRRNFHVFQPLLYQVATGGLSPANIATPLRWILRRQRNARVVLAECKAVDVAARRVVLDSGEEPYDTLVVATGMRHAYFGHVDWEPLAPGLKTLEDATEIRRRIFLAFEAAERDPASPEAAALLTFVVVGGGPTGVEMAGALAEIAKQALRRDFRRIDPSRARIVLVEGADRVLGAYPEDLSRRAEQDLRRLGVEIRLGTRVVAIDEHGATLESPSGREMLPSRTITWAAGVEASPLGRGIAAAAGVTPDRAGRVRVGADLSLPGHPEIFVIGDLAIAEQDGHVLPGIAPVAMQEGRHVARVIAARLAGRPAPALRYRDKGQMATIGRKSAVGVIGRFRLTGVVAWLAWLFVHLMYLIAFQNKVLVLVQWTWSYVTFSRAARLITGPWRPGGPPPE